MHDSPIDRADVVGVHYEFDDTCVRALRRFWEQAKEEEIGGFLYERDLHFEGAYAEYDDDGIGRNTTTTFRSFYEYLFHTHPVTPYFTNPPPTPKDFIHFLSWGGLENERNAKYVLRTEFDVVVCSDGFWTIQKLDGILDVLNRLVVAERKRLILQVVFYAAIQVLRYCTGQLDRKQFMASFAAIPLESTYRRYTGNAVFRQAFLEECAAYDLLGYSASDVDNLFSTSAGAIMLPEDSPAFAIGWESYSSYDMVEPVRVVVTPNQDGGTTLPAGPKTQDLAE